MKELETLGLWQCWRVTAQGVKWKPVWGSWCVWAQVLRAGHLGWASSLVLFRVAPEAEPMIRRHHQCEDWRRGRTEGKGRGGWSTWGWISSYLMWPLSRIRNLISDLLDIQFSARVLVFIISSFELGRKGISFELWMLWDAQEYP